MDISAPLPVAAPESPSPFRWRTWRRVGDVALLLAVACLPYLNSLRNDFVYDDVDQILVNPYLRSWGHLREIFTSSVWSFMGDFRGATNYYRPFMSLGYLFCYQCFGPRSLGFHAVNVVGNAAVVLLVFLVTLTLLRSRPTALVAACLFALHPIHTEAVDWIAAVTEIELACFYLLTVACFLASARAQGKSAVLLQIAMGGCFALALLSKEQALTLPVLAAVYEHFFRDDRAQTTWRQKLWRYRVLWLLAAVYLLLRLHFLGELIPSLALPGFSVRATAFLTLAFLGRYAVKLIVPAQLCAYYLLPVKLAALYPWMFAGAAALVLSGLAYAALRKTNLQVAFGVVWLLLTLAPVLNVRWMSSSPFAERYLYLPSVGFCWIAAWAGVAVWRRTSAAGYGWRVVFLLATGLLVWLAVSGIVTRNRDWHDNVTFYQATLAVAPEAYYIHNNLGTVYWGQGSHAAAEKEWRIALQLAPGSEYVLHNLGLAAQSAQRYDEATDFFLRALAIRPNYSDAHLDLGKTYAAVGQLQRAELQLQTAATLSPLSVRAHNALSEFYFDRRDLRRAEAEARRSVAVQPTPQGYWDLGLPQWLGGDHVGAEQAFLLAEALAPADSRSHFMLGLLYMDSNRISDAIREYRAGLQIDPHNADAFANLKKLEFLAAQ